MKITKATHILFIALIVLIVFSSSLKNDFVWDDEYLIINNPHIKSWDYLPRFFTHHLYEGDNKESNFYRPLQLLSFRMDYSFWKLNPFGYHLTSLLLHISNSILVYLIAIAVVSAPVTALIASLLFGIAPTVSSTTYYIAARSDLLMAFFIFLSVLFFIIYRRRKKKSLYAISITSFGLSLLCKEMAIILPLLLIATEIFQAKEKRKKALFRSLQPYLIMLIVYIFLRGTVLNFAKGTNPLIDFTFPATIPLWRRLLTDFKVIVLYLKVLILPFGLHMGRFVEPARTIFQADIILYISIFIILISAIKRISSKYRPVLFGALWFLFSLLPVLNIYPISVFFGEGWLYIPSVGFFIIFSVIYQDIIRPRIGKVLANSLIILFLIYYSLFTVSYGKVWKDSISLYKDILRYEEASPFSYLTYNNIAIAYYNKGEFKKSIDYSKKGIALNPGYPNAYNNIGITYIAAGEPVKAIKYFKKAISIKRDYPTSYCNLAKAYYDMGLKDKALKIIRSTIKLNPDFYKAYSNLGYMYSGKGDTDSAIEPFKKAIELRGEDYEAHYCLGALYIEKNEFKEALSEYEKALKLGLGDYVFYNEIAFLYIKNGRFQEAEKAFRQSILLNPHQPEPHNNLGNLYSAYRYFDLAMEEYRMALDIDSGNLGIISNLKKTKVAWKDAIKKNARR